MARAHRRAYKAVRDARPADLFARLLGRQYFVYVGVRSNAPSQDELGVGINTVAEGSDTQGDYRGAVDGRRGDI